MTFPRSSFDISESANSGKITASGDYVGGLFGYVYAENTYSGSRNLPLRMTDLQNSGDVTTGGDYVGGIIGMVQSDDTSSSYIQNYTNTGTVTSTTSQYYCNDIFGYSNGITRSTD